MHTRPHRRRMHFGAAHGSFEGRSSRAYDIVARRFMRRLYRRIAEDIALVAPMHGAVLDVGTGPGALLAEIAQLRPDLQVTGVDQSPDMVAAAAHNVRGIAGRLDTLVGDVTDLSLADGMFDVIVTSFSLHHWDDVDAAVPELARVLRPGGQVHVYDFPRAPFEALDAAARTSGVFADWPARHSVIRTGQLHLRHCIRHVLGPAAEPGTVGPASGG